MNINIISGKCSENCSEKVFEILRHRDKSKKHIVIAPDRCLFSVEKSLFEKLNESCFFDLNVISLSRLSKSVIGATDRKLLTKNSGIALVRKLLAEHKDELLSFKKSTEFMGFAKTIFETICLYKSCNITPDEVYTDESLNYSNLKQKDIKLIYTLYEEYLQKDYTDSLNRLMLFASKIDKDTFKDTYFYFIEFDDFTSIMYQIIYKLSKFSDGVYITCNYGKGSTNANIYSNKVYYDLIGLYKTNGLMYKIINADEFVDDSHRVMLNNLLAYTIPNTYKSDKIEALSFNNINDEIKYTVASIYGLALSTGLDYSNFAILVSSLSEYKTRMSREMDKYGIPYYFDESEVLSSHPLIRLFEGIWRVLLKDYLACDLINILKSPILNFEKEQVLEYDNYLKVISATPYNAINIELVNGEVREFFDMILSTREIIRGETKTANFIELCHTIFDYIVSRGESYASKLSELDLRVYTQVINKFGAILDDYLSIFGSDEIDAKMFFDTLFVYFENTNISLPPISSNTIFIAGDSSYLSTVKYLFVLGANEGKFPAYKLDNGLVTDEEIARLPNASKINPTISAINNRKLFKTFEFLMKFDSKLYVSYMLSGTDGNMYPSTILLSLIKLFGLDVINGSNTLDYINNSVDVLDEDNVVFNNLSSKVLMDNVLTLKKQWHVFESNRGYRELLSSLYKANKNDKLKELFAGENVNAKLQGNHDMFKGGRTSVSQIENFYSCPYKHYVNYGLRLRESVKPKLMPNDIGTIFHSVFKDLLPYILKVLNEENVTSLSIKEGRKILERVLNLECYADYKKNPQNSIILKSIASELDRSIDAIIYSLKVSHFKPRYYEYSFSAKEKTLEGVRFIGSIDRVDVYNDKFMIIDYKTGGNDFSDFTDLYTGKKLQLLAYAKFFEDASKLKPTGVFYLPISNKFSNSGSDYRYNGVMLNDRATIVDIDSSLADGGVSSKVLHLTTKVDGNFRDTNVSKNLCLSSEDFEYLLDYSILQVKRAIRSITNNTIAPNPLCDGEKSACDYCKYKGLCNYMGDNDRQTIKINTIDELKNKEGENGGV